jgi:hypothetical protein
MQVVIVAAESLHVGGRKYCVGTPPRTQRAMAILQDTGQALSLLKDLLSCSVQPRHVWNVDADQLGSIAKA